MAGLAEFLLIILVIIPSYYMHDISEDSSCEEILKSSQNDAENSRLDENNKEDDNIEHLKHSPDESSSQSEAQGRYIYINTQAPITLGVYYFFKHVCFNDSI